MSKTATESSNKEWTNIDYTNTSAYRTVKNWNKEGIHWEIECAPAGQNGGIPHQEFNQLKYLRKLDSILKPNEGPVQKIITSMHRQLVLEFDNGQPIKREYLTLGGEFRGFDWSQEEHARSFIEGVSKKPIMGKVYRNSKKFDKETGENLGKTEVRKIDLEYYYELPKETKQRKKFIDSFIEAANGTFAENITYYYKDPESGNRDNTFPYQQFCDLSIEELRDASNRGAGAKGPGYHIDRDGILRDKEGTIVSRGIQ
jgi:hypothetical protein